MKCSFWMICVCALSSDWLCLSLTTYRLKQWVWNRDICRTPVAVNTLMFCDPAHGDRGTPAPRCLECFLCYCWLWSYARYSAVKPHQPHVSPLALSNFSLAWELLTSPHPHSLFPGSRNSPKPTSSGHFHREESQLRAIILCYMCLSEQSHPTVLFIMMSCLKWMESCHCWRR